LNKLGKLLDEISSEPNNKVLVFSETKRKFNELDRTMRKHGLVAKFIHKGKVKRKRDRVLHGKAFYNR
jgi:superfamily II DNA/RNA helicase